ncbi:GPI transamidase component PIG-S [Geodia barretti]|uniref:GPI transamidase component PIG-S n=1 Tax=Geodia barretti TaxID=519541 RepID=A0AA35XCD7_GEOBA|nr:GPI transamidase component PIG-S [Geodia barretti]
MIFRPSLSLVLQAPPSLVYTISVLVLTEEETMAASFLSNLQTELANHTVRAGEAEVTLAFLVQPLELDAEVIEKVNEAVSSAGGTGVPALTTLLPASAPGHYSLLIAVGDKPRPSRVIIGAERWAFIHTTIGSVQEAVTAVKSMVVDEHQLKWRLEDGRGKGRSQGRGSRDTEEMRQVRAAQGYQVCLTLVAPDSSLATVDWNIEDATDRVLMPFLNHPGIARLANFTISSQVFHYTDLKFSPQRSKSGGYYVSSTSLPPMISSVESKLGSLVSQLPSLNFLVLVAPPTHSPLLIRDPRGALTDNFLVPQWGGVVIFSPPGEEEGGEEIVVRMEKVMSVFVRQLQLLLGVPITSSTSPGVVLERGTLGMTEWQLDQLMVGRMVESVSTATTALISLVELLDKVKNMVISDVIQKEVIASLGQLQECYRLAGDGELEAALTLSQRAMVSAETAFFDPSILELLYFPDDQKFAIYIPLFLPISIPIVLSSVTAFRWLTSSSSSRHSLRTSN